MNDTRIAKTVDYFTLGCKLNFAETSTVGKALASMGIRRTRQGEQADFCVINTCSVTELADKKSRQLIRRVHKSHPDAYTIVTGCYAQLQPADVAQIDGVDLVVGTAEKKEIPGIIHYIINEHQKPDIINHQEPDISNEHQKPAAKIITSPVKEMNTFTPSCSADDRTRHFLKVQDGCDFCCSYCTVPLARGRSRNGSVADIVRQAEAVAEAGGKEIVLTGVNTGDFGKSTHETFIDLLKALDQVQGIERFRISSLEPNLITDEIIAFVAGSNRFMPHFHIPLQSGSDAVLQLMSRRYDAALFRHKTEQIKKQMPDAFIGVDVIVGMRGETETFFNESKLFIESIPFTQLHVFSYSERPGTQALNITPVVPPGVKHERSKQLLALSEKRWSDFYENQIGQTARALFEHARKGKNMVGFTGNYVKIEIPYQRTLCNQIRTIRTTGWNDSRTALRAIVADGVGVDDGSWNEQKTALRAIITDEDGK